LFFGAWNKFYIFVGQIDKRISMRIQFLLILIPCLAGFFWFLAYLFFAPRNDVFKKARRLIAVLSLFFLFGFLSADPESRLMLHFTLLEQVCALAIVPCFISYIKECGGKKASGYFYMFCCILPVLHFIVGVESVFSAGFEDCVRLFLYSNTLQGPVFAFMENKSQAVFYACYTYVFGTFLVLCFLLFATNMMACAINGTCRPKNVFGFFFKGQKCEIVPVQYFLTVIILITIIPALLLGRRCYVNSYFMTVSACLFLAFLLSMIAYVGTAGQQKKQSLKGLFKSMRFGDYPDAAVPSAVASDSSNNGGYAEASSVSQGTGGFGSSVMNVPPVEFANVFSDEPLGESFDLEFEKFMLEQKMYLRRDLSLSHAAEWLGVEKVKLNDYMERTYGMSFMNYLNMLRIDYAELYILGHGDVTQKDIALACGFSGASAFNTTFSKLTGVTPKIWKARYSEMAKRNKTS
jgi:AraC-like DNA-binding protein